MQVSRVTKVVKGGKQMSFRAVVVVGDEKGKACDCPSKSRRTAERRDGGGTCSGCCHAFLHLHNTLEGVVSAQSRCLPDVWVGWLAGATPQGLTPFTGLLSSGCRRHATACCP